MRKLTNSLAIMRLWIRLILYTIRFCFSKGLPLTGVLVYFNLRRLLLKAFFDTSKLQIIAQKISAKKGHPSKSVHAVLFLYLPEHSSKVYRVANQVEQLTLQGLISNSASIWDLNLLNYVDDYDIFILHRIPDSKIMTMMVKRINKLGKVAIYDIDDLDFEPSLLKRPTPILTELGNGNKALLMKCNYALTTNEYLATLLREKGKTTFVNRNCLNLKQIEVSEEAFKRRTPSDRVRIGYFSGTPTHDYDFLEATEALIQVMNKYESVDLYIAGRLKLSPRFEPFEHRIKRLPFVHWSKLPFNIARVDINLAPLEGDDPFTECKSELKYFEPGILGIPTIASPVSAFKFAIRHGQNGLLASNTDEWVSCLELLINDQGLRKRIGENARQHVKDFYNPHYRGKQLVGILQQVIEQKGQGLIE